MSTVLQRLLPLILFNLAVGFMFHYSIVFPYLNDIGFTTSQLVTYAVVSNVVVFLVEVPLGILADRWSRKGVLLTSLIFMAVGCVLLASVSSFGHVMIATAIIGLYYGMSSGVQEAMLYDLLLENNARKSYEKILGRLRTVFTIGLVISSIAGAALASTYSFQLPFYLSVISCATAFVTLLFFKEPKLHREVESEHVLKHAASLYKLLARRPEIRLLVVANILIGVVFCFILEVDPLWLISLGLATVLYGPLNALLLSSQGLAGLIAGIASLRLWLIRLLGIGILSAAIGLSIQNIYLIVVSQFVLVTCASTLMIILSGRIQDTLPSSQRSGSESAISTV